MQTRQFTTFNDTDFFLSDDEFNDLKISYILLEILNKSEFVLMVLCKSGIGITL